MTLKEQLIRIKENWLLVAVILLVLFVPMFGGMTSYGDGYAMEKALSAPMIAYDGRAELARGYVDEDFAPDVEERKITKSSSMGLEVERGEFKDAEARVKVIISSTDSFILNENVNRHGDDKGFFTGYYQIKVDSRKYDSVVAQLKDIGEVQSFSENARDITSTYESIEDRLSAEKTRLDRYKKMYDDATRIEDKITLNDRIFNQERVITSLENQLKSQDERIEYTTISLNLREEQSGYVGVAVVKFSQLIRNLVSSFNSLLSLIFVALPYAIVVGLIWLVVRFVKNR